MLLGQGLTDEQIAAALRADPTSTKGAIQAVAAYINRRALEFGGPGLTSGEKSFHELMQRGMSYPAIAQELGMGKRKARLTATRVKAKLRVAEASSAGATDRLSARQAQIAYMAASGLTDGDIAERLGISARTVESHVSATLSALGLSSRLQLAETLAQVEREAPPEPDNSPVRDPE